MPYVMEEMHIAALDIEQAKELADCVSILRDLEFVVNALDRLRSLLEEDEHDAVVAQALWTAALVTYVRCFSTGKRVGLAEDVFEGVEGRDGPVVEVHRHFKQMRDKHIAHSVNPFEVAEVGAILTPPGGGDREVEGIGTLAMGLYSSGVDGVASLQGLAQIAGGKTEERRNRLHDATEAAAKELDLDELYRSAALQTIIPSGDSAGRPRS